MANTILTWKGAVEPAESSPSGNEIETWKGAVEPTGASSSEHTLLANDVESASEVSVPAVGQEHAILANDVESASEVSSPAVGQVHVLLADDVQSTSELTSPAVGQEHALLADDVESASEVSVPTAASADHVLLANDVESASEVGTPSLTQIISVAAPARGGGFYYRPKRSDVLKLMRLLDGKSAVKKKKKKKELEKLIVETLNHPDTSIAMKALHQIGIIEELIDSNVKSDSIISSLLQQTATKANELSPALWPAPFHRKKKVAYKISKPKLSIVRFVPSRYEDGDLKVIMDLLLRQ
ncbi:MAG: hypothetical protein GY727_05460 [Gammaproteobacteria bacterium]|nr:hypothetical protein [Gammaproteobacteria bacterium]